MISFNAIPINIRTPGQYIEFDNSRASRGLPALAHRVLIIGPRLSTGAIAANTPFRVESAAQAEAAAGRGSVLAAMCAAAKNANRYTEIFAVGLSDLASGSVQATGTLTYTGTVTTASVCTVMLGGVSVSVDAPVGMTAAQLATALAAAINARTDLPVTAAPSTGVVTLTFRHKGLLGNRYSVRPLVNPIGISLVFTLMTGGTANADCALAVAAMTDEQYNTVISAFNDDTNLDLLEAEMARRWGPMVMREGQLFTGTNGSVGAMTTDGLLRNSPHTTMIGIGQSPTPYWIWAAVAGVVDAFEPDPARPRQTLLLPGCALPNPSETNTREERNTLLASGVSTYVVDASGDCRIERLITTYRLDAGGNPDESYLDIETMRTLAYLRATTRIRIAQRFPRHKLADDGTQYGPGQAITTPSEIKMELLHLFREWEEAGLVENFEQFKSDLLVERNASDRNRVDAVLPPDTVNQLRVFAASIQFIK